MNAQRHRAPLAGMLRRESDHRAGHGSAVTRARLPWRARSSGVLSAGASCLLVLALGFTPLLAEPPTEASIKEMFESGEVAEALAAARERAAAKPRDADAHVLLANALLRKALSGLPLLPDGRRSPIPASDAEAVVKELEVAAEIAPARKDVPLGIVDAWAAAGRDEEMIAQMGRCATAFPLDLGMMNGLLDYGFERQSRSDPLAGRIFETIHRGYPRQPDAVTAWAAYKLSQGDLDRSLQILEAAEAEGVSSSELLESIGDVHVYRLDFPNALKVYAKASALDPTRASVRLKWATALQLTDPKGARILIEPLQGSGGGKPPAFRMGRDGAFQSPSRTERVVSLMSRALGTPTLSAADAQALAKNLWKYGLSAEALVESEIVLVKDPLQLDAMMLRAEIFTQAGLFKQALEALERAESVFEAAPDRTFAFTKDEVVAARATAQSRLGRDEDALATYKRTSDRSANAYAMGLIAERLGRIDEARSLFQQVITAGRNPLEIEAAKSHLAQDIYRKKP